MGKLSRKAKPTIGRRIVSRMTEFADALEADGELFLKFTCRKIVLKLEPADYNPVLVKRTRAILRASQALFAKFIGVSVGAVQSWERGTNEPSEMACRFMDEIRHNPTYWRQRFCELVSPKLAAVDR